jgi:hypothetical protein
MALAVEFTRSGGTGLREAIGPRDKPVDDDRGGDDDGGGNDGEERTAIATALCVRPQPRRCHLD